MNLAAMQPRLLVIDDDLAFARFVKKAAEACAFEVTIGDLADWRQTALTWHPTVIVLDLKMPGLDGIEALRHLAADKCTAEIVLASGVDHRTLEAAARLGSARGLKIGQVVQKPVRAAQLQELLNAAQQRLTAVTAPEIAEALAGGHMFLEYQPKLDCSVGRVTAAEALIRWRHPRRGIIPPDRFLPIAETADLMDVLTDWVVGEAAAAAARWRRQGSQLDIAVNISGKNLHDIDLPDRIAQRCEACGIAPDGVILELTETHAMGDAVRAMDILTRLRLKGFQLSIDDFGTGYSSLVQLHRMPFSELKIDRSFVSRLTVELECREICEVIVMLAHKLGLKCVAEGVETADTLEALLTLGCDGAQGYYLSRPITGERLLEFAQRYGAPPRAEAS